MPAAIMFLVMVREGAPSRTMTRNMIAAANIKMRTAAAQANQPDTNR